MDFVRQKWQLKYLFNTYVITGYVLFDRQMPLNNLTRSVHRSKVSYPPTTPPTQPKIKIKKRNPINIEIYKENSSWERISYSTRPLKCTTWFYLLGLVSSLPKLIKRTYYHRHRHHIIWIKHWLWCLVIPNHFNVNLALYRIYLNVTEFSL